MRRWPTLPIVRLCSACVAGTVWVALWADTALAADKAACVAAHGQSQLLRRQGKLRAAREKLFLCASPGCPALVSHDCTGWLDEVAIELPSVVVVAQDAAGHETAAVRVLVDGEVVAKSLDGKPIEVDPGEHVFRYELADGKFAEATVLIQDREKARTLRVDFGPSPASSASSASSSDSKPQAGEQPEQEAHISPLTWVIGGVGVAALGAWAYFGLTGLSDESQLSSNCHTNCNPADVSNLKTKYALADVSLGVGVVALGVATVIGITSASHAAPAQSIGTVWFDVAQVPGGGAATVGGRF